MENKLGFYEIEMIDGSIKKIPKKKWIEEWANPRIKDISDKGKLTYLFYGLRIVDAYGNKISCQYLLKNEKIKSARIIKEIYPLIHYLGISDAIRFRRECLPSIFKEISGYDIIIEY
ncbi:MAG: hypothetical protein RR513_06545 [Muribaculaceae bacterium]